MNKEDGDEVPTSESHSLLDNSQLERPDDMTHSRFFREGDEIDNGDDVIIVLDENDDLRLRSIQHTELQSPMRIVSDVLREAENIMTDGPVQPSNTKENQQVLIDEVDVEYSPRKAFQPIEIVVRHHKVTEHATHDSSDEEDDEESNRRGRQRLETVNEGEEQRMDQMQEASTSKRSSSWKKGHRRAWSMPNAKGEKMTLAVIHDKHVEDGNKHSRRVVRYRLNPHKAGRVAAGSIESDSTMAGPGECKIRFDMTMPHPEDDDNELEVEINEEEVIVPGEEGKGARTIVKRFWEARWKATNFETLPEWLQDNEYLKTGHRPPLSSFSSCFKSIFALHTETGNIWTHMYGCVAFIGVAIFFLTKDSNQVQYMEKIIFSAFFFGAITCLGMSFIFHTVACHSDAVGRLFSKLDYAGITLLIVGSFIPWIYYAFNCRPQPMLIYITMITILGIMALIVSLWDKFAEPKFRPVRAGVFVAMGLSAVVPAAHLLLVDGLDYMINTASLYWMLLMGGMYIGGAVIYATRVPERCFPGKCDLWFQSHQLFHSFVVAAAFIHFHAITEMAMRKLEQGSCAEQLLQRFGVESKPSWLGTLLGMDEPAGIVSWSPDQL